MSWFERIFRRRRLDDDLAEELREHIEERTEQIMRLENLSRSEAREAALRAFGNPTPKTISHYQVVPGSELRHKRIEVAKIVAVIGVTHDNETAAGCLNAISER